MEQRSDEWFAVRAGKATGSRIADIVAKTKSGPGASRANYAAQLVAERLTGKPADSFSNAAMQWGTDTEPMAREAYEMKQGGYVEEVGFLVHPNIPRSGASPDGLVGEDGPCGITHHIFGDPCFLLCAENGSVGERGFFTSRRDLQDCVTAGLIVTILTTIKNKHVDESTPLDLTVDGEVFVNGRGKSNRHMFPPNLVCRSATFCKPSGVNRILWIEIGVVVYVVTDLDAATLWW